MRLPAGGAQDDLRPISCRGRNSQGGIGLTLIDALDTLVVSRLCWELAGCWAGGGGSLAQEALHEEEHARQRRAAAGGRLYLGKGIV